jgi:hypothetical protein
MVKYFLLAVFALCVAFGGIYVYRNWIRPVKIQITLPAAAKAPGWTGASLPVAAFHLDGKYRLTSVKVVAVSGASTNQVSAPLWHLVSTAGSRPVDRILYGVPIEGMAPAQTNHPPQRLLPDLSYRITVEAGPAQGSLDFKP